MLASFDWEIRRNNFVKSADHVTEMIKIVVGNNNSGCMQSTQLLRLAHIACCYMRKWNEQLMMVETECRYFANSFGTWTGSLKDFEKFAAYANTIHRNIKPWAYRIPRHLVILEKDHVCEADR